jgi:hypothetical protein
MAAVSTLYFFNSSSNFLLAPSCYKLHMFQVAINISLLGFRWPWVSCPLVCTAFLYVRFRDNEFLHVGSSAPCPTPNLEDQGLSLSLAPPSKPVRHRWPYQQLHCCWHRFWAHWCTQALSPSNKMLLTRWRCHQGRRKLFSRQN